MLEVIRFVTREVSCVCSGSVFLLRYAVVLNMIVGSEFRVDNETY